MPDHDRIRMAAQITDLVRMALALADEAGMSIVAIHLEDALESMPSENA